MEVKNTLLNNLELYKAKVGRKPGDAKDRAAPVQTGETAGGDRVSLSDEARLHMAAQAEAIAAPEVRREKVDALKQAIADGTYAVDVRKVAQKLVTGESLLVETLR